MSELKWYYQGKEIDESFTFPENTYGFIYKITKYVDLRAKEWDTRGFDGTTSNKSPVPKEHKKIYIGKKCLTAATKKKVGKRESARQLADTGDKRKVKKIIRGTKMSNWFSYNSSSKPLLEEIKSNPELFHKEILEFAHDKKHLTYLESKHQFRLNVLEVDSYNDNIGGRYYRKDFLINNQ